MTTIYALSSGHGKAGVAVIRISGPASGKVLEKLAGEMPPPRTACLRKLRDPRHHEILDDSLVIWFPGPASFTGEHVVELHIHGGRAVIEAVFGALAGFEELRLAEPGEFTRQAFENGKLDLTAAEGLADLIDAETQAQRRQALRQSSGALRKLYDEWRFDLIDALARIEAELDFSDEGDVPDDVAKAAHDTVSALLTDIRKHLNDGRRGEILRDGFRVVIAGPPNAGKSSLMNALAQRDVAIVSSQPGTTRDVIEVRLDLGGYPVILMDTAGIREAAGEIEQEGIRRALDRAETADLVLWIADAAAQEDGTGANMPGLWKGGTPVMKAINKIDLVPEIAAGTELGFSVHTGAGLERLIAKLTEEAAKAVHTGESAAITRLRHRNGLEQCAAALEHFLAGNFAELEMRAEDLRYAAAALGRLTGRVDVEDILDKIFADFCIGK